MVLNSLLKDYHIILASSSPRRKMLLAGLDIDFKVFVKPDIEELFPEKLGMLEIPVYLARAKSDHYLDRLNEKTLLITADTIVWYKDKLVGKPETAEEAVQILSDLSGNMHEVVTGVCLRSRKNIRIFYSHSKVYFRNLTQEEIAYYVDAYKPLDKAGAYGIQEWIGYIGIEKIDGSFYNVMGLPVQMLYHELTEMLENEIADQD